MENFQNINLLEQLKEFNVNILRLADSFDVSWLEKCVEPTSIIALAIVILTFMQWKTSHKQRKQDLFDKRYALYEQIFGLFYQKQMKNKKIEIDDVLPYANEATFLFDDEVSKHVLGLISYGGTGLDCDWFNKPFEKYMKVK